MQQLIHGNLIHAPALGRLEILEHGWMLLEDGTIRGLWREKPAQYAALPVTDYGNALVMQSFADMHLHAPQYPMLGMGMDLPAARLAQHLHLQNRGALCRHGLCPPRLPAARRRPHHKRHDARVHVLVTAHRGDVDSYGGA